METFKIENTVLCSLEAIIQLGNRRRYYLRCEYEYLDIVSNSKVLVEKTLLVSIRKVLNEIKSR